MNDVITMCKEQAAGALHYYLNTLSFVPEDKLHWRPTPMAKSAFEITAHCAGYSGSFAEIIRAGGFPWSGEEFRNKVDAKIDSIATLEQAKTMLQQGIAETLEALDTVKPEQIGSMIDAPHGKTPFNFLLTLPAHHLDGHACQIDYLQTCWDDQVVHF